MLYRFSDLIFIGVVLSSVDVTVARLESGGTRLNACRTVRLIFMSMADRPQYCLVVFNILGRHQIRGQESCIEACSIGKRSGVSNLKPFRSKTI